MQMNVPYPSAIPQQQRIIPMSYGTIPPTITVVDSQQGTNSVDPNHQAAYEKEDGKVAVEGGDDESEENNKIFKQT